MACKSGMLLGLIILLVMLPLSGCFDEDNDDEDVAPGSTIEAEIALEEAEEKLEAAGLGLSFEEPGDLVHIEDLLPTTDDLKDAANQARFEESIEALNTVLSELEQETADGYLGSISDRALVHLYLGLVYLFDAVSRMLLSDDPAEDFIIELNPGDSEKPLYSIGVSAEVQAELDATEDALDYPLAFTHKERQAIIDAVDLIDDAIAKPVAPDIQPRRSSVDRAPYYHYAIWHFQRAASLFNEYAPEIAIALDDFNTYVENMRAKIQSKSEYWGFTYTLPPGR